MDGTLYTVNHLKSMGYGLFRTAGHCPPQARRLPLEGLWLR